MVIIYQYLWLSSLLEIFFKILTIIMLLHFVDTLILMQSIYCIFFPFKKYENIFI